VDFFAGQAGVGRVREFSVLVGNNEFPRSSIGFYLARSCAASYSSLRRRLAVAYFFLANGLGA
jgi:hypothetical protein